jgi:AraC-like DNA-binding protein
MVNTLGQKGRRVMRRVAQSKVPEGPFLWTRGIAARETLRHLEQCGIDAEPLLAAAGLSRDQLSRERDAGVSVASQYRFLELAAVAADDTLFGLHLVTEMDLRNAGILFYLIASSTTILEALEKLARYVGTTNEAVLINISRDRDETVLRQTPVRAHDEPRRQWSEFTTLAFIRIMRMQTGRDFAPSRITFTHARNAGVGAISRFLRCPVEFASTTDSWVFPQSVIELPITSEDSQLLQILTVHADDLLAARRTAMGLQSMVENKLLTLLPTGKVQAAEVARQLGMSTRSFTRHLAGEGTTFAEILDRLRNRLALRYISDERISLQQIAWLLGYSELAAFGHAFRRWHGTSPGRARSQPFVPASA